MELREFGIFQHEARLRYNYDLPRQCRDQHSSSSRGANESQNDKLKLSLKNLSAAFVLLISGYVCAAIAFIGEKLLAHFNKIKQLQPSNETNE